MTPERTTGGLIGKLAGKAKEVAADLTRNDELAREGRLQQAQAEAEVEARREQAEAEQRLNEAKLEEDRAETDREREERWTSMRWNGSRGWPGASSSSSSHVTPASRGNET